jgi:hypothetical protein
MSYVRLSSALQWLSAVALRTVGRAAGAAACPPVPSAVQGRDGCRAVRSPDAGAALRALAKRPAFLACFRVWGVPGMRRPRPGVPAGVLWAD